MVSLLTSSWNGELDSAWMPSSNTGNLSQTFVGLPWQLLGVPSAGNALETMTLGYPNDVNHLILVEDGGHRDLLLEVVPGKLNLIGNGSSWSSCGSWSLESKPWG